MSNHAQDHQSGSVYQTGLAGNAMLTPYDEELTIGSRFADRYQILSVVGRGAMGIVYQARHDLMGRVVAIKTLRGTLQLDERSVKRFEREARAASRMDHPNLIAVHDFDLTAQRQPYLVMEYVDGLTLYDILKKEKKISPERAVRIFSQVCDALYHAHSAGVIHRDLKPANIMVLDRAGERDFAKVFDLGIAKIAFGEPQDREALTGTGEVCGSPVYLSPEQCTHQRLDHRSDIYSLGVVMYELLTGVPPIMGETVYDTIYMHVHAVPPSFKEVNPDIWVPTKLEQVVMKALEKNPDDRQQTMQELKFELLASLQKGEPELQVLPPVPRRTASAELNAVPAPPSPSSSELPIQNIVPAAQQQQMPPIPRQRQESTITRWLHGTPLEPLSQVSPTKAAIVSGAGCIVITAVVMTALNMGTRQNSPVSASSVESPTNANKTKTPTVSSLDAKPKHILPHAKSHSDTITARHQATSPDKQSHASGPGGKLAHSPAAHHDRSTTTIAAAAQQSGKSTAKPSADGDSTADNTSAESAKTTATADNGFNFFSIFSQGQKNSAGPKPHQNSPMKDPTKANVAKSHTPANKGSVKSTSPTVPPREHQSDENPPNGENTSDPSQQTQTSQQRTAPSPYAQSNNSDQQLPPPPEQRNPNAVILYNQGVRALSSNPELAIEKFQAALKLEPSYKNANVGLGKAFYNYGNQLRESRCPKEALVHYKQAVEIFRQTMGENHILTSQARLAMDACSKDAAQ